MMESMLLPKIRAAIIDYTANHMDALADDRLTASDWIVVEKMARFLKQFEEATLLTEGRKNTVAEVLPVIDYLLEAFRSEHDTAEQSHDLAMTGMLKIGWALLDKYYSLTDRSPAYVAAVLLHSRHKWAYFTNKWKPEWVQSVKASVRQLWVAQYKNLYVQVLNPRVESPRQGQDLCRFERWFKEDVENPEQIDELEDYCSLPAERGIRNSPAAIGWWLDPCQQQRFSHLNRMAVDILSIPTMSPEVERLFSECKMILTDHRHSLSTDSIEALVSIKRFNRRTPN
jgi:hypothetical protein